MDLHGEVDGGVRSYALLDCLSNEVLLVQSNELDVRLQSSFNLDMLYVDVIRGLGLSDLVVGGRIAEMVTEGS